jgi:hypothetical protein
MAVLAAAIEDAEGIPIRRMPISPGELYELRLAVAAGEIEPLRRARTAGHGPARPAWPGRRGGRR